MRAGVRVAAADPFIVRALLATVALGFSTDPVQTLAPALADAFGRGGDFVGWIGSSFGPGPATASLVLTWLRARFPRTRLAELGDPRRLAVGTPVTATAPVDDLVLVGMGIAGVGSCCGSPP